MRVLPVFLLALSAASAACPDEDSELLPWSDEATWNGDGIPDDDDVVDIVGPVLLDTTTASLGGIHVKNGGRLVFKDDGDVLAKLVSAYVLIEDGGEVWIGGASEECRFRGKAEILLTGDRDGAKNVGDWGQKFVGVEAGGSFGVYGHFGTVDSGDVPWTKLAATAVPQGKTYDSTLYGKPPHQGFQVYLFDAGGELVDVLGIDVDVRDAAGVQAEVTAEALSGAEVAVAVKRKHLSNRQFEAIADTQAAFETAFGIAAGSLSLTELKQKFEPWVLAVQLSDPTNFAEAFDNFNTTAFDVDGAITDVVELTASGIDYFAAASASGNKDIGGGSNELWLEARASTYLTQTFELADDVSGSWSVGDKIVVASTDFDHEQAERFEITAIDGSSITVSGEMLYEHFGEIYQGVDMRAEVGMLTRNIKIHGEMNPLGCTTSANLCEDFDFDNFGGHTKAVEDFQLYEIQGAELYHMGQSTVLGAYPIHYHMTFDTTRNGGAWAPLVQGNAIHDTFSRCVTIHGTHNVTVRNNVAFDHYGHCFFLEDGGEQENQIIGNLGLVTRKGHLTESDEQPTTFWITSPRNTLINNAAAGSDYKMGVGIWYLFPDRPVGPSNDSYPEFYKDREAKYTPIYEFRGNSAHSNGNAGFGFFRRLDVDHGITDCSTYNPRDDPDPDMKDTSNYVPVVFDSFTGYKNRKFNAISRSSTTQIKGFRLADSAVGLLLVRNMLGGYQRVSDTVIVGESPNVGVSEKLKYMDEDLNKWVTLGYSNRSFPNPNDPFQPIYGVVIKAEGPTHLHGVDFHDFVSNDYRDAAAITFDDEYRFHAGAVNSVSDLTFTPDEDTVRIVEEGLLRGPGDDTISFRDLDGSLTGRADSIVTQIGVYFTEGDVCHENNDWNLQYCERDHFVKSFMIPNTRDEAPNTVVTLEDGSEYVQTKPYNFRIGYALKPNIPGRRYVMHWEGGYAMPDKFGFRMAAMEGGDEVVFGVCMPTQVAEYEDDLSKIIWLDGKEIEEVDSMEDLEAGNGNIYFDRDASVIYHRYTQEEDRADDDYGECPDNITWLNGCPFFQVKPWRVEGVDLTDGDCRGRM